MSDFLIRSLGVEAAADMAALYGRCFHNPWEVDFFEERLSLTCIAEGAFQGENLCGFILVQVIEGEGEILTFCVDEDYRGRGLGQHLLEKVVQQSQIQTCFLEVNTRNKRAIALYERVGFKKGALRKGYYKNSDQNFQDAIIYHYSKKTDFF